MKRRDEVLVGVLMTVGLAIAIIGTIWLSRGGISQGYPLYARFGWGSGLKQGQQVQRQAFQLPGRQGAERGRSVGALGNGRHAGAFRAGQPLWSSRRAIPASACAGVSPPSLARL